MSVPARGDRPATRRHVAGLAAAGRVATVAAVGMTVAALAGCSTEDGMSGSPTEGSVTVLAAASLTDVVDELAAAFEAEHPGIDVVVSVGGSSALAEQIVAGIDADLFVSADEATMQRVVAAGLATDPVVVATNTLEIAVPTGNPGGITGVADLADPERVIALCDPAVPCGAAAERLLGLLGVDAAPDTLEPDVRSALTKVVLGEVDAALVYRTDVVAAGDAVQGIVIERADEAVNRYPAVVLDAAPHPDAARDLLALLRSPVGAALLADAGFGAP